MHDGNGGEGQHHLRRVHLRGDGGRLEALRALDGVDERAGRREVGRAVVRDLCVVVRLLVPRVEVVRRQVGEGAARGRRGVPRRRPEDVLALPPVWPNAAKSST